MEILSHAGAAVTSKKDAIAKEQARAYSQFRGTRVDFPAPSPQTQISNAPGVMSKKVSNGVSNGASKSETIPSMAADTYPPFIQPSMDDQSNPLARMEMAYQKPRTMRRALIAEGYRDRSVASDSPVTSVRLERRDIEAPVKSIGKSKFSRAISEAGYRSDPVTIDDYNVPEGLGGLDKSSTYKQLTSADRQRQNGHFSKSNGRRSLLKESQPHSDPGVSDSPSSLIQRASLTDLLDGVEAAIDSMVEKRRSQEGSQVASQDAINEPNGQATASPHDDRSSNGPSSKRANVDDTQPHTPYTQNDISSLLPQSYQLDETSHNTALSATSEQDRHLASHTAFPPIPSIDMDASSQPNPFGHPAAPKSRDSSSVLKSTSKKTSKLDFDRPSKSQPSTPSYPEHSNEQSLTSPSRKSARQKRQHAHSLSADNGTNATLEPAAATARLEKVLPLGAEQLTSDLGSPSKKIRLNDPADDAAKPSLIVKLKTPQTTPKTTPKLTLKLKLGQSDRTPSDAAKSQSDVQPLTAGRLPQAPNPALRVTSTTTTPISKAAPAKVFTQATDLSPELMKKLSAKPHLIRPPTPETNSHNWSLNPTWITSQQQKLLSGPSHHRLTTLLKHREIHQSERGRWTFETSTWPLSHHLTVRSQLEKFVEGNSLGCMTYARIKANLPGDLKDSAGLGRVEVWCFGEQVDATYLAILIMTRNWMVPGFELRWVDVEGKVVVEVGQQGK